MSRKIVFNAGYCSGSPRIEGTRLICANIVTILFYELSLDQFFHYYPYLTKDDILNCFQYCANQQCLQDQPINYCQGCALDKRPEIEPAICLDNFQDIVANKDAVKEGYIFWGTREEYEEASRPKKYWILAQKYLEEVEF